MTGGTGGLSDHRRLRAALRALREELRAFRAGPLAFRPAEPAEVDRLRGDFAAARAEFEALQGPPVARRRRGRTPPPAHPRTVAGVRRPLRSPAWQRPPA